MTFFPLLKNISIDHYGLYPGSARDGHFDVEFRPGLTMVLGANGLGKTTLMILLYRMVAGLYDLQLPDGEIGNANLSVYKLSSTDRRQFAQRVSDGAQSASARLRFALADHEFEVERDLATLALRSFRVDGTSISIEESAYQQAILTHAHLGAYGDWLLLLRTLVFFFEDRRTLVWDYGAQRQLLRCLLLSPAKALEWTRQERKILELDSRMRNLQAALRKEQKDRDNTDRKVVGASGARSALAAAEKHLLRLQKDQDILVVQVEQAEELRQRARLDALRAEASHDKSLRELERARLMAVEAHLPTAEDSVRFIFARLMSDQLCLVCGTADVGDARSKLETALKHHRCVVCNSNIATVKSDLIDIGDERIRFLQLKVEAAAVQADEQVRLRNDSSRCYEAGSLALAQLATDLTDAKAKVDNLNSQLPPSERRLQEQSRRLKAVEELVTELRAKLEVARGEFANSLANYRADIQCFAEQIKQQFENAAAGFLFEDSALSWAPVSQRVGQAGGESDPVDYPAFAVELSGSDFVGLQRRDAPSQVSESQREFIDLAFRMALIYVASPQHAATLAVDAPESSLDAVFVDQAAAVLARFADDAGSNRLIITSNLGAGELVPALLEITSPQGQWREKLVDLFTAGVPTRAMEQCKASYDKYWKQLTDRLDAVAND